MIARGLIVTGALLLACPVQAKQFGIRCDVTATATIAGRSISTSGKPTARFYLFDDIAQTATIRVNGESKDVCSGEARCTVSITPSLIFWASNGAPASGDTNSINETKIDRVTGQLSQAIQLTTSGGTSMKSTIQGPCVADTLSPKF